MTKKPDKKYYTIEIEALIPATLTYRILAESAEQAFEQTKKQLPTSPPKLKMAFVKKIQAKVYKFGSSILELVKKF